MSPTCLLVPLVQAVQSLSTDYVRVFWQRYSCYQIPRATSYEFYISQHIRFARMSGHVVIASL